MSELTKQKYAQDCNCLHNMELVHGITSLMNTLQAKNGNYLRLFNFVRHIKIFSLLGCLLSVMHYDFQNCQCLL